MRTRSTNALPSIHRASYFCWLPFPCRRRRRARPDDASLAYIDVAADDRARAIIISSARIAITGQPGRSIARKRVRGSSDIRASFRADIGQNPPTCTCIGGNCANAAHVYRHLRARYRCLCIDISWPRLVGADPPTAPLPGVAPSFVSPAPSP